MADEESRKEKLAFTRLVPGAIKVEIGGTEVRIAVSPEENQLLNAILAAQGRALIHREIKKWRDQDATMTPKDLKDLMSSIKDSIETSDNVYKGQPIQIKRQGNDALVAAAEEAAIDITKLTSVSEPETPNNDDKPM